MSDASTAAVSWRDVGAVDDVPEGEVRTFDVGVGNVAVARRDGQLYAVQDLCTHDDGPLGEGRLDGFDVVCPRHGARFDVRTGAVTRMPAIVPITTFPVQEVDGRLQVGLPERPAGDSDDW